MAKDLEAVVRLSGDVDSSIRRAMENVADSIEEISQAAEKAADAVDLYSDKIDSQSDALKAAQKQYASYVLAGEESSEQAEELANKIRELSEELRKNKSAFEKAKRAAEGLSEETEDTGDSVDGLSDSAKESEKGFTTMKGAIAGVIANAITSLISKCFDAAKSIYGLAESTREYREDMAKLDTAFQTAGHSTDQATKTYKELYSVFGEEDRAVEAAQQIAKVAKNEQDFVEMTNIATGAWAMWGDSLATESLMEAVNSTSKIGTVQGTLADALEWCGINLDDYNKKLEGMQTESQRSSYIMDTLTDLYGEAANNYRENNATIIESRNATSDYTDKLAEMGAKIEPVTTAVTIGLGKILDKILEMTGSADMDAFADKVVGAFEWLADNGGTILAILGTIIGAFAAYKAVTISMTIAQNAATISQKALNLAMSLNPVGLVIAGIVALIAIFAMLWNKCEGFRNFWIGLWDGIKMVASRAWEGIKFVFSAVYEFFVEKFSRPIEAIKNLFSSIIDFIKNVFTGNWEGAWNSIVDIFKSILNLIPTYIEYIINGAIDLINGLLKGIGYITELVGIEIGLIPHVELPRFAAGGFTDGVSIAGEAGTEAIISFDPAYREQNLSYWAKAGRMLGAAPDDYFIGEEHTSTSIDFGGITFAPNIVIRGNADKQSIVDAIEEEYPEFIDMLEEYFLQRRAASFV